MVRGLRLLVAAGLFFGFVHTGAGADPDKADVEKMQGKWQVLAGRQDGMKIPEAELKRMTVLVRGDRVSMQGNGEKLEFVFKLNASKPLKEIDLTNTEDKQNGLGIYRFEKETWTLCVNSPDNPRPASFEAREDTILLLTMRRIEK